MFAKRWLILPMFLLLLAGCGDATDNKKPTNTPPSAATTTTNKKTTTVTAPQKSINEAEVAKRYAGKALNIVDVSEIQVNGVSTLSVTFSVPLKANQKFADKLHLVDSLAGKVDGGWELSKNQQELQLRYLEPKRKLVLTINAGIEAVNGEELAKEHISRFETKDLQAMLGFASRGSLFPVRLAEGLPVLTLNVNKVDIDFFRIKDSMLPQFLNYRGRSSNLQTWESKEILPMADLVYSGGFNLNPDKNTRETVLLPLAGIKPLQEAGVYFAVMRQSGTYEYSNPATVFAVTDIGLSVHRYKANDSLAVFTQSLEGGKPLANVAIQVFNDKGKVIAEAKTDNKGYAEIADATKADVILAIKDKQTTVLRLKSSALDLSEFTVAGPKDAEYQVFVFGPRDLYRPGETVLFNALLRDKDGRLVKDMPITAEVRRPDGAMVRSFVWKPEQQGFYQYKLNVSVDSPTGRWNLLIKAGKEQLQSYDFNIEDFLPERLALELKASETPIHTKANAQIQVTGRYLYGAPANGNLLSGQIYVRPLRDAVAKLPGYSFGSITEKDLSQEMDINEFALDKNGKGTIHINNQWQDARSPIKLIVQASLQESGGRPIVRRVVQPVWPSDEMVGVRPLFATEEIDEGSNAEFEIVMANADGDKLAAKGLKVRFIHERRDYYWYYSDNDGWNSNFNQKDIALDEQTININSDSTAKVSFPTDWGYYRLEVENPITGLITSSEFRSGYSWQENTEEGDIRPDQVKITLDKPAYKNGDTAKITLNSPSAGTGYLMIESSDGVLFWQAIDVPAAGKTIEIPINSKWQRHDLYISALVVRPGERKAGATPKRAVGVLHLPLERKERQLALTLTAPEKMRPSQSLTVKVQAKDANGATPKKINILVAAVDVGILNITNYKTPDPFAAFFGRKAYGVDQLDVYGQVIEAGQGRLASLSYGGDAELAAGGKRPNSTVTIVALQSQAVTLNAKGEGEVQLAIPDFNGELRLMAQAWTDDEFGMAEAKTVVVAPIVAELAIPRFLAGGDKSNLALDITNLTEQTQKLTVKVAAQGLVRLVNDNAIQITLSKGERITTNIAVKALQGIGNGQVNVVVEGVNVPGEAIPTLNRNWTIGVRAAYPAKLLTVQEVLKDSAWNIPSEIFATRTELDGRQGLLSLSSRPPLDLATQIKELQAYPYGCAEQTVSGLYPSLYSNAAMLKRLGIETKQTDEERRAAIEVGISRLLGMQRYNGSFGLWSNDSSEGHWLTVYVTDFLLRARERGFSVPETALNNANTRVLSYLQNASSIEPNATDNLSKSRFATQAYAGYVLARSKQAPLGALRNLYDRREHAPSGLSLVQLSVALKLMGDNNRGEQALREGLIKQRAQDNAWFNDYGSEIRDHALTLAVLQENQLASDYVLKQLFSLSQQVAAKRWLSTQERNAIFLAAYPLSLTPEKSWTASIDVAGKRYTLSNNQPALKFSDQEMRQIDTLQVQNLTNGTNLYQTLKLSLYPAEPPKANSSNGLIITKNFLDLTGRPVNLAKAKSGDLIIVHLHLYSKNRVQDALVVDFLPAGLELENQNLAQSSASLKDAAASINNALESMRKANIAHQEFRDDRYVVQLDIGNYSNRVDLLYLARVVTPGTYLVPPAMVESMYRPSWQATSAGDKVLIVAPAN